MVLSLVIIFSGNTINQMIRGTGLARSPVSTGRWIKSFDCEKPPLSYACSPKGYTWQVGSSTVQPFLTGDNACHKLEKSGLRNIAFVGDSYVRHTFEGLALVLSNDYEMGVLNAEGRQDSECHNEGQFDEKKCREYVMHSITTCNKKVNLHLFEGAWPRITQQHGNFDAIIWGGGNHPIDEVSYSTRWGIHDAGQVERHVFEPTCNESSISWLPIPQIDEKNKKSALRTVPRLFWLSVHARLSGEGDESEVAMKLYSQDSLHAIQRACGNVDGIDVFEMTQKLVHDIPEEAKLMTFDSSHWSRAVNVVKAQIVLYSLLQRQYAL